MDIGAGAKASIDAVAYHAEGGQVLWGGSLKLLIFNTL